MCHCWALSYAVAESKSDEQNMEGKGVQNKLHRKLRDHSLFFGITMGLLAEIINSRYFFLNTDLVNQDKSQLK